MVDHTSGDWVLSTLRELFVPFATYRLNDANLHARLSRVGSKCRITTHAGDGSIFAEAHLAQAEVACGNQPVGFGSNVLFSDTHTGVRISPDGLVIEPLDATEVVALLAKVPTKTYCYIPSAAAPAYASLVPYLDAVPAQILCEAFPSQP
jgi:hypothetical protein